jgi:hypothetical protein
VANDARPDDSTDDGTQPTLDLGANPTVELVVDSESKRAAAKPKRPRLIWGIIGGVVIIILIVGVVLVETVGRSVATQLVRDKIVASLGLESNDGVAVDLGSGSLIVQALTGGVDVVTVDIDSFEVNGITSSARLVATEVPLNQSKPLETLAIDVTMPGNQIDKLAGSLSGLELDSIELNGSAIRVSTVFELLFIRIPVAVDLLPVAAGDAIAFEPQSVLLGDEEISVADLRENRLFSGLAGSLLDSREFCVASSLPTALSIDEVEVQGTDLVIRLSADGIPLDDATWKEYGTCAEQ